MNSYRTWIDPFGWYRRLGLRAELATGYIAVIALTLVVGLGSLIAQDRSMKTVNELVDVVGRIADLSLESNVAMLKARRAEKDFLIFQNEFGFGEAKSRYATLLRAHLAEVRQGMADLRELSSDPDVIQLTRSIEMDAHLYEAGFLRLVDLYGIRGHVDTGLVGAFRERAHAMEEIVRALPGDRLMIDLFTIRRHERNFVERSTEKRLQAFTAAFDGFKADVTAAGAPREVKAKLLGLSSDYFHLFEQFAAVGGRIEEEQSQYLATAHKVEPLLEELHAHALMKARSSQKDAAGQERINFWKVCAAVFLAALLGLTIAWVISRRITRSVGDCVGFASRVALGHLSTRLEPKGEGEFATLAVALNRMTQVLEERDAELNHANDLMQLEVREHQSATERAEYLAFYDNLTALPNRSMFNKLLTQAIAEARRDANQLAVLFVDLDRFKTINDTLGHEAGDVLLKEIARRLQGCLRETDTVARLGGDEFVVLLPSLRDAAEAQGVAQKILAATRKSFVVLGHEFLVTASIGASVYPQDGDDEQSLMKNADIAMYQAKDDGKNGFHFYSAQMNAHSLERLALEESLRRALDEREFQLHYQPRIDARTGEIAGIEALLRWNHPVLGMVAPARFIPIAEETGLIVAIGAWVLRTACAQNVAWQEKGLAHLNMAVNLSARQFFDEGLLRDLAAILKETGMSPGLLELEVKESTLLRDADRAMRILRAFKELGVRLTIDNFGTCYSSLSTLRQFPADTIKIDGSFFRDLADHPENRSIADAIISVGKSLSLTVIAEGVETQAQVDFLRERSCDEFQGFYFSKPVATARFAELLGAQVPLPEAA
jgi:diguanylate cyclase (GGDEF)-like protein